jgi:hypothetical protein
LAGIEPTPARSGRAGYARLNLSATAGIGSRFSCYSLSCFFAYALILQVNHGKVTSDKSHASCSEDESESSFSATSASAYNTSRLLSMVQSRPSIRDEQLEVVLLLNEIAQQQRDSDLALKSVLSELQLLKSKAIPQ